MNTSYFEMGEAVLSLVLGAAFLGVVGRGIAHCFVFVSEKGLAFALRFGYILSR